MNEELLLYILAVILPVFGLVRLVWERKLEISRKVVSGTSAFYATVVGSIAGISVLWFLTGNVIYVTIYLTVIIVCYAVICAVVKKKEYPEEERFTKEW